MTTCPKNFYSSIGDRFLLRTIVIVVSHSLQKANRSPNFIKTQLLFQKRSLHFSRLLVHTTMPLFSKSTKTRKAPSRGSSFNKSLPSRGSSFNKTLPSRGSSWNKGGKNRSSSKSFQQILENRMSEIVAMDSQSLEMFVEKNRHITKGLQSGAY